MLLYLILWFRLWAKTQAKITYFRKELFGSIILSGATTLFPGFTTRVENDVKKLYKEYVSKKPEAAEQQSAIVNVVDNPKRKFSVFNGGAILANFYNKPESDNYWITPEEFNEGDQDELIKKKCQSYLSESR